MRILDWYILKRFLLTFLMMMLLFIPIGILIDYSEKSVKMIRNNAPTDEIIIYYLHFVVHFANLLFPIFLFLSVIWFTSKLAEKTEIVAMLSSGISYTRFLRPYFFGASFFSVLTLAMNMFIVPYASKGYNEFMGAYIFGSGANANDYLSGSVLFNQISDNEVVYVSQFNLQENKGYDFTLEYFEGVELRSKIMASQIQYISTDSASFYRLQNGFKRIISPNRDDVIEKFTQKDTLLPFKTEDLLPVEYAAEVKNIFELNEFIAREKEKGTPNVAWYELIRNRRWSAMITAFILTFIGVAVSSVKKRGGMGANLAFGVMIGFLYVFFDRVFGILAGTSGISPLMAVVIPNLVFLLLALWLIRESRR